jgi:hypothetical protein
MVTHRFLSVHLFKPKRCLVQRFLLPERSQSLLTTDK